MAEVGRADHGVHFKLPDVVDGAGGGGGRATALAAGQPAAMQQPRRPTTTQYLDERGRESLSRTTGQVVGGTSGATTPKVAAGTHSRDAARQQPGSPVTLQYRDETTGESNVISRAAIGQQMPSHSDAPTPHRPEQATARSWPGNTATAVAQTVSSWKLEADHSRKLLGSEHGPRLVPGDQGLHGPATGDFLSRAKNRRQTEPKMTAAAVRAATSKRAAENRVRLKLEMCGEGMADDGRAEFVHETLGRAANQQLLQDQLRRETVRRAQRAQGTMDAHGTPQVTPPGETYSEWIPLKPLDGTARHMEGCSLRAPGRQ